MDVDIFLQLSVLKRLKKLRCSGKKKLVEISGEKNPALITAHPPTRPPQGHHSFIHDQKPSFPEAKLPARLILENCMYHIQARCFCILISLFFSSQPTDIPYRQRYHYLRVAGAPTPTPDINPSLKSATLLFKSRQQAVNQQPSSVGLCLES